MKVVCRHGHFALYPVNRTEAQTFMRVFKLPIYPQEDYFTFSALVDLPRWSQVALVFGTLPAVVNFEAPNAWDVMRANEFVFSFAAQLMVPVSTIAQNITLKQTQDCLVGPANVPLIQPGSFIEPGVRLLNYWGELDLTYQRLYLSAWGST